MIIFLHKHSAGSWREKASNNLKEGNIVDQKESAKIKGHASKSLATVQSREQNNSNEEDKGNLLQSRYFLRFRAIYVYCQTYERSS